MQKRHLHTEHTQNTNRTQTNTHEYTPTLRNVGISWQVLQYVVRTDLCTTVSDVRVDRGYRNVCGPSLNDIVAVWNSLLDYTNSPDNLPTPAVAATT